VLLGSRTVPALAPGASHSANTTLTIPAGTPGGTYLIIARANETNTVAEIDTTNNERFKQTKVGPDLVISTLTAPASATAGTTITVTDTTTNQGAGNAGSFTVRVYLSLNDVFEPGIDPAVGSRVIAGLPAGTANTGPISVTIPAGISGPYILIAVADADNVVSEILETNNEKHRALNVLP
jgi:subtilase family serine protease